MVTIAGAPYPFHRVKGDFTQGSDEEIDMKTDMKTHDMQSSSPGGAR